MKLKKGKGRYKFPPSTQILHGFIEGNQKHNQMCHVYIQIVPVERLPRDGVTGAPQLMAFWPGSVEFWPIPDKPYSVQVHYTPPVEVW